MGELVLAGWADLSPAPSSRDLAVQKWLRWRHVNLLIWRPSCYTRPHLLTHTRSHDPYNYLIQFIFLYIFLYESYIRWFRCELQNKFNYSFRCFSGKRQKKIEKKILPFIPALLNIHLENLKKYSLEDFGYLLINCL